MLRLFIEPIHEPAHASTSSAVRNMEGLFFICMAIPQI